MTSCSFQEFDLSTEAMLRYTTYREDAWRAAIERALGDRAGQYEKVRLTRAVRWLSPHAN